MPFRSDHVCSTSISFVVESEGEERTITKNRMLGYAIANPAYETDDIAFESVLAIPQNSELFSNFMKAQAEGTFRVVLLLPSGPGYLEKKPRIIPIGKTEFAVGIAVGGGQLFGIGFQFGKKGRTHYDELFRIDYWGYETGKKGLNVHYHIHGDKLRYGTRHPTPRQILSATGMEIDREIWKPFDG